MLRTCGWGGGTPVPPRLTAKRTAPYCLVAPLPELVLPEPVLPVLLLPEPVWPVVEVEVPDWPPVVAPPELDDELPDICDGGLMVMNT